jgi:hypothetical protein
MKSEDFERLKAVCEKEGFEILNLTHDDNEKYVLVKKAKKIEKVRVEFSCIKDDYNRPLFNFHYSKDNCIKSALGKAKDEEIAKVGKFLASKLEEYLNSDQK